MDNDKKLNILFGISISAIALYLLNANDFIDIKIYFDKNKSVNKSTQYEYINEDVNEDVNKDVDINEDIKNKSKEIIIDDSLKKDIDIIEKDEIKNQEIKKKICLLNYIYNLSNFIKS